MKPLTRIILALRIAILEVRIASTRYQFYRAVERLGTQRQKLVALRERYGSAS